MPGLSKSDIEQRGHTMWAEVDLGAIRHNVSVLRGLVGRAQVMGVVKGYAYGHGNPASARAMLDAGATRLGVARVAEALHLREEGITAPIHVFTEATPESAPTIVMNGLTATVYTQSFAEALSRAAKEANTELAVHVKFDTGMHRVGLLADDVADAIRAIKALPNIRIEGAWTHLAVADVPDHPFTRKQLDLYEDLLRQVEKAGVKVQIRHAANSAATLSLPDSHYDMVRCGVVTYGLWPGDELVGAADLRPALSLRARIGMVKTVPAGDALSYGLRYELQETGRVVTVPAGYADGYDRRLSGRADVLIGGTRYRVSGTVCMDQFLVDVSDAPAEVGETVTLLGRDGDEMVTAEELARLIGTINYEVTTRVPSRVPRIYVDEAAV